MSSAHSVSDAAWQRFVDNHAVGDVIDGVVTAQVPFGSFVEADGVTGLAYRLEWPVGEQVSARILAIDDDQRRFSLTAA